MIKQEMPVKGMTCGNCVRHVERALRGVAGVQSVAVDLGGKQATVEYDPAVATRDAMAEAVKEAGYTLEVAA